MDLRRQYLIEIPALLMCVLFIYSGSSKLIDWEGTRFSFLNQVFPDGINQVLLYTIPGLEILIGALLLLPRFRQMALLGSTVLMLAFSLYVGAVLLDFFGRVPCSCGGVIESLSWEWHFVLNLFFLLVSSIGYFFGTRKDE